MTDDDFQDHLIVAKSRLIQGANEKTIRLEFAARGITADDLDRIIDGLDFSRQSAQLRRDRRYRLGGGIVTSAGAIWLIIVLVAGTLDKGSLDLPVSLIIVGLWFLSMGERALLWKHRRRPIRIGRSRDR